METEEKSLKEMLKVDWHEELIKYANAVLQVYRDDISEERRQRERDLAKQLCAGSPNLQCVLSYLEAFGDESQHS